MISAFSKLFEMLEQTSAPSKKKFLLLQFFKELTDESFLCFIRLITQNAPKKIITNKQLEELALKQIQQPFWLYETCAEVVKDVAERVALLLPTTNQSKEYPIKFIIDSLVSLKSKNKEEQHQFINSIWEQTNIYERYFFNRLLLGNLKFNVSNSVVIDFFSEFYYLDKFLVQYQLNQPWNDSVNSVKEYWSQNAHLFPQFKPFTFKQTSILNERELASVKIKNYLVEEYYEGIRVQLVKHGKNWQVWSNKGDLLTEKLPELKDYFHQLPSGLILEGVLISIAKGNLLHKEQLNARFQRKTISKKQLAEIPITFVVYDVLMFDGKKLEASSLAERKIILDEILSQYSDDVVIQSIYKVVNEINELHEHRNLARENNALGLILKDTSSNNTTRNYKLLPAKRLTIKAVLLYVGYIVKGITTEIQLTFAVSKGETLISFVKISEGISSDEQLRITEFVKQNTLERFGPVRTITPTLVYELSFETVFPSKRHKSGLVLKSPKIEHFIGSTPKIEIDTIERLTNMIG